MVWRKCSLQKLGPHQGAAASSAGCGERCSRQHSVAVEELQVAGGQGAAGVNREGGQEACGLPVDNGGVEWGGHPEGGDVHWDYDLRTGLAHLRSHVGTCHCH